MKEKQPPEKIEKFAEREAVEVEQRVFQ